MKEGDAVFHIKYGRGIVERIFLNKDIVNVKFFFGSMNVDVKYFSFLADEEHGLTKKQSHTRNGIIKLLDSGSFKVATKIYHQEKCEEWWSWTEYQAAKELANLELLQRKEVEKIKLQQETKNRILRMMTMGDFHGAGLAYHGEQCKEWWSKSEYQADEKSAQIKIEKKQQEERLKKELELIELLELQERAEQAEKERIRLELLRKEREIKRNELFTEIRRWLTSDFLDVDSFFHEFGEDLISQNEFEQEKINFVKWWIGENTPSKNGVKNLPDDEQIAAIAAVHGHIQVIARAGSGKTTTLVNRTLFLLKHCGVDAGEMLLLAFNRKAASEIRRRLLEFLHADAEKELDIEIRHRIQQSGNKKVNHSEIEISAVNAVAEKLNINLPHVMTFHALAYAIVRPEESILFDGAEGESQALSRSFQQVIDDYFQIPEFKDDVRDMMLAHFQNDWDRIVQGGYDLTDKTEFVGFRRSLKQQSLNGDYIKSFGEKIIANFLFEHDVTYKYEQNHWWSEINYRPDFTLFLTDKTGVIIEYFGLQGDVHYDEMTQAKRDYWSKKEGWKLIEFYPHDIASNGEEKFLSILKERLQPHDFPCVKLSDLVDAENFLIPLLIYKC